MDKQLSIDLEEELIVDNFAGGGGASTGIEIALGRSPNIAVNHDAKALAMHRANHPDTKHYCEDVFEVDPFDITSGRPVGLAWFSPDCTHHSKARGKKPKQKKIRGLAWAVINWVNKTAPRVIFLENVEEFQDWGPLDKNNEPIDHLKGWYFKCFRGALKRRGYTVEFKEMRAADYGAPTIRKRLFLIARNDGKPIVWPEKTHAPRGAEKKLQKTWRPAHECIDWRIPAPSIFERSRPLAEATCKRIAKGLVKYVLEAKEPFFITEFANASNQRNMSAFEPMRTQCAQVKGGHFALVTAFLAKHYTGVVGNELKQPLGTVTTKDHHSIVAATLTRQFGASSAQDIKDPLPTVMPHGMGKTQLVVAFLTKYYGTGENLVDIKDPLGTITTRDRFGLITVTIGGEQYVIADIGMRMLQPNELFAGQGFPDKYIHSCGYFEENGRLIRKSLTKTEQVKMCGNSVSPPNAAAIVAANVPELKVERVAA